MNILVWVPNYSLGGGSRLFIKLINTMIANPRVDTIELIMLQKSFDEIKNKVSNDKIKIYVVPQRKTSWIDKGGRIYSIPGTGLLKRVLRESYERKYEKEKKNRILDVFKKSRCDIIYCFWPHSQKFIKARVPIVCTLHDTILFEFPELGGAYFTNVEKNIIKEWLINSTKVIVSSQNTKKNVKKYLGNFNNIHIIRHDTLPDILDNSNNKINLNLPAKYIIYPANTSRHKNHYNLLVAWSKLSKAYRIPLVFIGLRTDLLGFDGEYYPLDFHWSQLCLNSLIKRLNLRTNKDFFPLGYVDDQIVLSLIKNAYALIMPSLSEGGGSYPVEEALTVGTPVLCSDIPVMREHLNNRTAKIGWFDPLSVDSIIMAVDDLIKHYDVYKKSTVNGMKDKRPSWEFIANRYIDIFEKVIQEHRDKSIN